MKRPTLLRYPITAPNRLQGEEVLPRPPSAYQVTHTGDWWVVVEIDSGVRVYGGPGPVEVVRSPAPF